MTAADLRVALRTVAAHLGSSTLSGAEYMRERAVMLATAAELGRLDLEDAVALTLLLLAAREPRRHSRAAARWVRRFCVERPRVELVEAELLLSLLGALPHQPKVTARGLEALFTERGERALAEAVRRWQVEHRLGRNSRP